MILFKYHNSFTLFKMCLNNKKTDSFDRLHFWWGIVRYLRTNTDELRGLVENDKNLTQNKKYTIMTAVLND